MDPKMLLRKMREEVIKRNAPVLKIIKEKIDDPFWILIKAILSTRTKDEITLKAFKSLKERFKGVEEILNVDISEIEKLIYPVGFYKQKAKYIKEVAIYFNEKGIPKTFEELIKIPGVGEKVAKIYLLYLGKDDVIPVDTHVRRITSRIFGKNFKNAKEVEKFLKSKFPKNLWKDINWIFVGFGQTVCLPRNPKCNECPIREFCSVGKNVLGKNSKR